MLHRTTTRVSGNTTVIRDTKKFQLFEGFNQTAGMYAVLKKAQGTGSYPEISTGWMPVIQKNELMELSDEDFDEACKKYDYR